METLDDLKKQLYHTQQMLISANAHIRELTDEHNYSDIQLKKDKYRAEAASLRKDNYNLLDANIRLIQEKNDLQSEFKTNNSVMNRLLEIKNNYKDKWEAALKERDKLKEAINSKYGDTNYKEKYENCQAYLKIMTNERDSLQSKLTVAMDNVRKYADVRDRVTKGRDDLQKELTEAESLIRSIRNSTDYYFNKQ